MAYAVIGPDGLVEAVEDSLASAKREAARIAPEVALEVNEGGNLGSDLSGIDIAKQPEIALRLSGLPRLDFARDVAPLSLEEAFEEIHPLFPSHKTRKSGERVAVASHATSKAMIRRLLGQNYKTEKADDAHKIASDVEGLSLLPAGMAQGNGRVTDLEKNMIRLQREKKQPETGLGPYKLAAVQLPMRGNGLCAGSNAACRTACLVYSGKNTNDAYNVALKYARTRALLQHPAEFVRVLAEAIRWHQSRERRGDFELFIRLNVFSDVPWELVCPGLFEGEFRSIRWYDYTKVAGRSPPKNYDLTFSWSGTNYDPFCREEFARGRRIAVVFLHPPGLKWIAAKKRTRGYGLPKTFLGMPVIDGDVSDIRPRDPGRVFVGLRYKRAKGQGVDPGESEFIVPARKVATIVEAVELEGWLVVTQSARQEPITDADQEAA